MKRTNKILSLLLSFVLILSFAGCSLDEYTESFSQISSSLTEDNMYSEENLQQTPSDGIDKASDTETVTAVDPSALPAYSGSAYIVVDENQPNFSSGELTTDAYERYSILDDKGRCGVAIASCGIEIMPQKDEERKSISSIYPSGWVQEKYSGISGGYLWNRCHLIGWQLSAENDNEKNLITGTRYMNTEGMLPFENMVADYIKETGNHVAYRVTPVFGGNNLVCSGVQMEAYSIEDDGDGICFNVYCYNVQPGIKIDYATGESTEQNTGSKPVAGSSNSNETNEEQTPVGDIVWIPRTGSKYHSTPDCSNMKNSLQVTKEEAEERGYEPCKKCY